MKKIFILFLLCYNIAVAQVSKTTVNAFVEKPTVQWAIYYDEVKLKNEALSKQLLFDYKATKLRCFDPITNGNKLENKITYYDKLTLKNLETKFTEVLKQVDENNDVVETTTLANDHFEAYIQNNAIITQQILYVENGRLQSKVTRASITKNIITPSGNNLGEAAIVSFANNSTNKTKQPTDKIIDVGVTKITLLNEDLAANYYIKKMYNQPLIDVLWPYIENNKIKCYDMQENKLLKFPLIPDKNDLKLEVVNIPTYDSLGNLFIKKVFSNVNEKSFNKIAIEQQWYYNATQQIFYNKVVAAYLYFNDINKNETYDKPLLKIVF
ncbi:hypothetical protein ACFOWM_02275 [Ferruginibacter yonginensis]|uniref:Uncharacterized protein n=1 Tax=Ferruginibacter yonginensis TaxID=1310416 RepID=A0ABV8QPF1_9BACT